MAHDGNVTTSTMRTIVTGITFLGATMLVLAVLIALLEGDRVINLGG